MDTPRYCYELQILADNRKGKPRLIQNEIFGDYWSAVRFAEADRAKLNPGNPIEQLSIFYRIVAKELRTFRPPQSKAPQTTADERTAGAPPKDTPAPVKRPRAPVARTRAPIAGKSQHAPTPTRARSTRAPRARK